MNQLPLLFRLNRSLKLSLRNPPLFIAFMALVVSGVGYQLLLLLSIYFEGRWSYLALHGIAMTLATFWLFLGLSLNVRYFHSEVNKERLTVQTLLGGAPSLIRYAAVFCFLFVGGTVGAWCALTIKHALLQVPYLGLALSILFAWLPYAILLVLKLLPFVIAGFLYWLVPLVSIKRLPLQRASVRVVHHWKEKPLESILCTLGGLLPLILALWLVSSLQHHTLHYLGGSEESWVLVARRFVLAVTSAVVLAPAISLFGAWGDESLQWIEEREN